MLFLTLKLQQTTLMVLQWHALQEGYFLPLSCIATAAVTKLG